MWWTHLYWPHTEWPGEEVDLPALRKNDQVRRQTYLNWPQNDQVRRQTYLKLTTKWPGEEADLPETDHKMTRWGGRPTWTDHKMTRWGGRPTWTDHKMTRWGGKPTWTDHKMTRWGGKPTWTDHRMARWGRRDGCGFLQVRGKLWLDVGNGRRPESLLRSCHWFALLGLALCTATTVQHRLKYSPPCVDKPGVTGIHGYNKTLCTTWTKGHIRFIRNGYNYGLSENSGKKIKKKRRRRNKI